MRYDHLRHMKIADRPKSQIPPYERKYFAGRRLMGFLALCLLVIGHGIIGGVIQESWWALLSVAIGIAGVIVFHVSVCSGMSSSNVATYFRDSEPVRFWFSNALVLAAVCLSGCPIWFLS